MLKRVLSSILLIFGVFVLNGCIETSEEYKVSFITNVDGETLDDVFVKHGEKLTIPNISWEYHSLDGWFQNESYSASAKWLFGSDVVTSDLTLYALWRELDRPANITKSSKTFLTGTQNEFVIHKFESDISGPTIFIIGGIHGDERAGWNATQKMVDANYNYDYKRGTVYVLPVASRAAFLTPPKRYFGTDLNRTFPGSETGTETDVLAYTIYHAIKDTNPDCVIDCHESRGTHSETTYLGDQIILHDQKYNLFVLDIFRDFNKLPMMADKKNFNLDWYPPSGSINREFTDREQVPVFTIETNRGTKNNTIYDETQPLQDRIDQQLALIDLILKRFEVIK